jgi:hypothetical protein
MKKNEQSVARMRQLEVGKALIRQVRGVEFREGFVDIARLVLRLAPNS